MRASTLWKIAGGLLTLHVVLALSAWSFLPPRVPTHFGLAGRADAWESTSAFTWFGVVVVSALLVLLIYALMSQPDLEILNLPEKERLLRLTPEQQTPVIELVRIFGAASAICIISVFLALHLGIYLTARGHSTGLPWFVQLVTFGAPAALLLGIIPWSVAIKRIVTQVSHPESGKAEE